MLRHVGRTLGSSRVHARRRYQLAGSAGRREKGQALAGACGGSERHREAVDRNNEDVSLDALEPTIAYHGRTGSAPPASSACGQLGGAVAQRARCSAV